MGYRMEKDAVRLAEDRNRREKDSIQSGGSGMTYLLIYLFSDGLWEGLTTEAGRKMWEGSMKKGREECLVS